METLDELKIRLKEITAQGIDLAIPAIKAVLFTGSDAYNDIIALEGRYQEIMKQLLQGTISQENSATEINKIRVEILGFIDLMQESQLNKGDNQNPDAKPDIYNGEVFYRIPKQMKLQEETKCIVRLAFDRKILTENLEVMKGDVTKDLRISDVMGVELLDPEGSAFEIRTIHDIVQFVEKDLYTEWIFHVKALTSGTHPLVLKISIIEMKNGIERKRNIVLEEEVEIITTAPVETGVEEEFSKAGLALAMAGGLKGTEGAPSPPPSAEPAVKIPQPGGPPPSPSPTPNPAKGGGFRKMASALSAVLVLVVASWAIWNNMDTDPLNPITPAPSDIASWDNISKEPSKEKIEDFLNEFPGSEMANVAKLKLDSIETSTWETAIAANSVEAFKQYSDLYPNGRYFTDATRRIEMLNQQDVADNSGENIHQNILPSNPGNSSAGGAGGTNNNPRNNPSRDNPRPANPNTGNVSTPELPTNQPVPLTLAYRYPVFRGCENKDKNKERNCTDKRIGKYIEQKLEYPSEALREKIQGVVLVHFIVEKDGKVSSVQYTNDPGGGCGKEAARLVQRLPKFIPGQDSKGKPIRVKYRLPIKFKLR